MRYTSLLAATGLLMSGLALAAPAQAAPAAATAPTSTAALPVCKPLIPAKLVMRARKTTYTIGLDKNCPASVYNADWKGVQPGDDETNYLNFTNLPADKHFANLELYAFTDPTGSVGWGPAHAEDPYATDAAGNNVAILGTLATTQKFASSATITAGRKGAQTTVVAKAGYYNPKTNKLTLWPNKQVNLQYKAPGTTVWKHLAKVTTNKSGAATFVWSPNRTMHYRVYVPQAKTIWDFFSAAISK
ncbi:hypothetical protein [Kribbella sp. NPDC055071]